MPLKKYNPLPVCQVCNIKSLGNVPVEPDLESDAMATDAQFQKDVKSAEI